MNYFVDWARVACEVFRLHWCDYFKWNLLILRFKLYDKPYLVKRDVEESSLNCFHVFQTNFLLKSIWSKTNFFNWKKDQFASFVTTVFASMIGVASMISVVSMIGVATKFSVAFISLQNCLSLIVFVHPSHNFAS